jgi:hypothetical protein
MARSAVLKSLMVMVALLHPLSAELSISWPRSAFRVT